MSIGQNIFIANIMSNRLQAYRQTLLDSSAHFLGFPVSQDYDYTELMPFMPLVLNNVGDPYVNEWHGLQTKEFEREVISFFIDLFRGPQDDIWGYVTNGSTEGNLYAMYVARQKYPDAVMYYSEAAHYSVLKKYSYSWRAGSKDSSLADWRDGL